MVEVITRIILLYENEKSIARLISIFLVLIGALLSLTVLIDIFTHVGSHTTLGMAFTHENKELGLLGILPCRWNWLTPGQELARVLLIVTGIVSIVDDLFYISNRSIVEMVITIFIVGFILLNKESITGDENEPSSMAASVNTFFTNIGSAFKTPLVVALSIVSLAVVISVFIFGHSLVKSNNKLDYITVTGLAQKEITSDIAVWSFRFSNESDLDNISTATHNAQKNIDTIREYLKAHSIDDKEIYISPADVSLKKEDNYDKDGNINGSKDVGYIISYTVSVRSESNVDKIIQASQDSNTLIEQDIKINNYPLQFFYSKLGDLKIEMLTAASEDARTRAQQIATNSHNDIGNLKSADMGVFQITDRDSTEVSNEGYNDTASLIKKISVVVHTQYYIK